MKNTRFITRPPNFDQVLSVASVHSLTDLHNKTQVISLIIALALFAAACDGGGGSDSGSQPRANSNEGGPDVGIKLGKGQAISKVQVFLEQRGGSVTIQLPYKHFEMVSRPCSQTDVDYDPNKYDEARARCKPVGGSGPSAPYGSKTVQEWKTKCCRSQTTHWSTLRPTWTALYSKDVDSWSVNMEFDGEAAKNVLSWIVNDKSGAVTEKPSN